MSFLTRNSPSQKPELWQSLPGSLLRHGQLRVRQRVGTAGSTIARIGSHLRMQVDLNEQIGRSIYLYGTYDYSMTRKFLSLLRTGMVVCDIGANIGFYSLLSASVVGPDGAVYAFEPIPAICETLRANVALNGFRNVTIVPTAASDISGKRIINVAPQGQSSLLRKPVESTGQMIIACITLDEFLKGKRKPDLLKIDAEGAECHVLEGGRELISRADGPSVICELNREGDAVALLKSYGYQVQILRRRGYEPVNLFACKPSSE